jgi:hypothetical protein
MEDPLHLPPAGHLIPLHLVTVIPSLAKDPFQLSQPERPFHHEPHDGSRAPYPDEKLPAFEGYRDFTLRSK